MLVFLLILLLLSNTLILKNVKSIIFSLVVILILYIYNYLVLNKLFFTGKGIVIYGGLLHNH